MLHLRVVYRLICLLYYLLSGVLQILCFFPYNTQAQKLQRIQRWSHKMLSVFEIKVKVVNLPDLTKLDGVMIVSNHVSWVDIFAINAILPGRFIAKEEVRQWPVIGYLADRAQTIFISRQRGDHSIHDKVKGLASALNQKEQVTLFPEGTSTDGQSILPFKSSFFQAAIDANVCIVPLLCFYPKPQGKGVNLSMAYYGDVSLFGSIIMLAKQQSAVVELHFHAPIDSTNQKRQQLAEASYQTLVQTLIKKLEY